jgi:hypothetical protein
MLQIENYFIVPSMTMYSGGSKDGQGESEIYSRDRYRPQFHVDPELASLCGTG